MLPFHGLGSYPLAVDFYAEIIGRYNIEIRWLLCISRIGIGHLYSGFLIPGSGNKLHEEAGLGYVVYGERNLACAGQKAEGYK